MATKKIKLPRGKSEPTIQEANYLVTALTNVSMRLANLEANFNALATNVLRLTDIVMAPKALVETVPLHEETAGPCRTSDH